MIQSFWNKYTEITEKAKTLANNLNSNPIIPSSQNASQVATNIQPNNKINDDGILNLNKENFHKKASSSEPLKEQETIINSDGLLKENEKLKEENQTYMNKLNIYEKTIESLNEQISKLNKEINDLKTIKNEQDITINELKERLNEESKNNISNIIDSVDNQIKNKIINYDIDYSLIINQINKLKASLEIDNESITEENIDNVDSKTINNNETKENNDDEINNIHCEKNDAKEEIERNLENNKEDTKEKIEKNEEKNEVRRRRRRKGDNKEEKQEVKEIVKNEEEGINKLKKENNKNKIENDFLKLKDEIINVTINYLSSKIDKTIKENKEEFTKYLTENILMLKEKIEKSSILLSKYLNEEKEKISIISKDKLLLENKLKAEEDNSKKMKNELESAQKINYIQQNTTKKLNEDIKELTKKLEKNSKDYKFLIQTFKQFYLLNLEDEIFIDEIELTFKNSDILDSNKLIEKILNLSKYIRPKIIYNYNKSFLINNKEIINKLINKYNLIDEEQYNRIKNRYEYITSLDVLLTEEEFSMNKVENLNLILIYELDSYIENLNNSILSQSKKCSELNNIIKVNEENRKKEIDKILSLQNDIKEKNKTIKENDKNLTIIQDLKNENDMLKLNLQTLRDQVNNFNRNQNNYNDKISNIKQQCDLFKIENTELVDKNNNFKSEIDTLNKKLVNLNKEISLLKEKNMQLEKVVQSLKEQDNKLAIKENEYKKLQNSYMNLESFLENIKNEKDNTIENYQNQIKELITKNENLNKNNQELIIKINRRHSLDKAENLNKENTDSENEAIEVLEKKITEIEIENKSLKEQKEKIKNFSEEICKRVKLQSEKNEFLIDKRMISSILFKYFDPYTNYKIKASLLETLANFMNYDNTERNKLGLPSINQLNNVPVGKEGDNEEKDKLKKLGDELYDFILKS